jgi:hypothetical protein
MTTLEKKYEYTGLLDFRTQEKANDGLFELGRMGMPIGGIIGSFGLVQVGPLTFPELRRIQDFALTNKIDLKVKNEA